MPDIEHEDIPDANLHQPKGAASALAGALIVCDGGGTTATTGTPSTPVNLYDNEFRRPALRDYSEVVNAIGTIAGTTQAINYETGNAVTATLGNNVTFSFTNPPASGKQGSFTLILTQDGTGSRTVTWPASVNWAGGTAPTLTTTAGAVDISAFLTTDGGTTWYGFSGGLNF